MTTEERNIKLRVIKGKLVRYAIAIVAIAIYFIGSFCLWYFGTAADIAVLLGLWIIGGSSIVLVLFTYVDESIEKLEKRASKCMYVINNKSYAV